MPPSLARPLAVASLGLAALVAACGPDDPQLAMCQKLANGLVADVAGWERTEQNDTSRARTIDIAYSTEADTSGSIECRYPINASTGAVATAPDQVVLNGRRLGTRELLAVGTQASGELISETADATAERSRELAGEAGEKAREVADRVREETVKGAKALQETLER